MLMITIKLDRCDLNFLRKVLSQQTLCRFEKFGGNVDIKAWSFRKTRQCSFAGNAMTVTVHYMSAGTAFRRQIPSVANGGPELHALAVTAVIVRFDRIDVGCAHDPCDQAVADFAAKRNAAVDLSCVCRELCQIIEVCNQAAAADDHFLSLEASDDSGRRIGSVNLIQAILRLVP